MNHYGPNTPFYPCERCDVGEPHAIHACVVNAGATVMFWGDPNDQVFADADKSPGPGSICGPNHNGDACVWFWLSDRYERLVASYHWLDSLHRANALARRFAEGQQAGV